MLFAGVEQPTDLGPMPARVVRAEEIDRLDGLIKEADLTAAFDRATDAR